MKSCIHVKIILKETPMNVKTQSFLLHILIKVLIQETQRVVGYGMGKIAHAYHEIVNCSILLFSQRYFQE